MKKRKMAKPAEPKSFDDRSHLWPCCHFNKHPLDLPEPRDPAELEQEADRFLAEMLDLVHPPVAKKAKAKRSPP